MQNGSAGEEIPWHDYWSPKLYVENAIGELKSSVDRCVRYDPAGLATVCETRLVAGTFFEFMELNKFPFDSQVNSFCLFIYLLPTSIEIRAVVLDVCLLSCFRLGLPISLTFFR